MSVKYTEDLRPTLQCRTFPLGSFDKYKYVVICSYYEGMYMFRNKPKSPTTEQFRNALEKRFGDLGDIPYAETSKESSGV